MIAPQVRHSTQEGSDQHDQLEGIEDLVSTTGMNRKSIPLLLTVLLLTCLFSSCSLPVGSPSSNQTTAPEVGTFFFTAVGEGISMEVSGRDEEPATPTGLRRTYLIPWLGILLRGGGEGPEDGLTLYFPKDLTPGSIRLSPFVDKPGRPRAGEVTALFHTQGVAFGALEGELSIELVGDDQTLTGSFQLTAVALSDPNRTVRLRGWFRRIPLYPPPFPSGEATPGKLTSLGLRQALVPSLTVSRTDERLDHYASLGIRIGKGEECKLSRFPLSSSHSAVL